MASSVSGFVELGFPFVVGIGDNCLRMCRSFLVEVLAKWYVV